MAKGPNKNGAVVNYVTPTASDICDSNVTVVCVPPSGSVFMAGTNTVVCTATDDSGNTNACSFKIAMLIAETRSFTVNSQIPDANANGLAGGNTPAGSQFHFVVGRGHFGGDGPGRSILEVGQFIETGAPQAPPGC